MRRFGPFLGVLVGLGQKWRYTVLTMGAKRKPTAKALAARIPGVRTATALLHDIRGSQYERPAHSPTCKCAVCDLAKRR